MLFYMFSSAVNKFLMISKLHSILQEPAGEQETTLTEPVRAESEAEATEMRAVSQPLELSTSLVAQVTVEEEPDGDRPQPIGIDATDMVQIRQFPREDLMLQEKLGEGEYGPIYRCVPAGGSILLLHDYTRNMLWRAS